MQRSCLYLPAVEFFGHNNPPKELPTIDEIRPGAPLTRLLSSLGGIPATERGTELRRVTSAQMKEQ